MKDKHIQARIEQCLAIAKCSTCPRRQFGALLLEPNSNVVLVDAYNGPPRGDMRLCGGEICLRDQQSLHSGHNVEVGCVHAEMNCICNAARNGVCTNGAWMIVNGESCLMCAKLIHHAGIVKLIVVNGGWTQTTGIEYLKRHGVEVEGR
jgi:dCMP deaminase